MNEKIARLQAYLDARPYARFLGAKADAVEGEVVLALPFSPHLIGNTALPALHGGVIGAIMELSALSRLTLVHPRLSPHQTIDVTIEYLRPGRPQTTLVSAHLKKVGRRIANVQVEAWQESRDQPIAALRGHFLLGRES
ncbi:MAG: thioesterase [Alphaproteobacteria bacterium PA2]|nr:MAG: thioesterase [Alphaproteobacteria bacterium PA2]